MQPERQFVRPDAYETSEPRAARPLLRRGTPHFRRVNMALMAAGFATFALLYCVQPLLPVFAAEFRLSPSAASLALSATTITMAFALLVAGRVSDRAGRKTVMSLCLLSVGCLTIASAFALNWPLLLFFRSLEGLALSGIPAAAMAYLGEEVHPGELGGAIGLYIGGNALGGMAGRVLTSLILQATGSWRLALGSLGCLGLASAAAFILLLPESHYFKPVPPETLPRWVQALTLNVRRGFENGCLRLLYAMAFLLMGSFIAVYNYAGFYLADAPFCLDPAAAGAIFLAYLFGAPASVVFGRLSRGYGQGRMLLLGLGSMLAGVCLTLPHFLPAVAAGIILLTIGLFGGHSVASGWVTLRANIGRGQAASLYFFCYYAGSSLLGSAAGEFYSAGGWPGIVALVCGVLVLAIFMAIRLMRLEARLAAGEAAPV